MNCKNKVNELKKDKKIFREYIKIFCNLESSKQLFKNNKEFNKLKEIR